MFFGTGQVFWPVICPGQASRGQGCERRWTFFLRNKIFLEAIRGKIRFCDNVFMNQTSILARKMPWSCLQRSRVQVLMDSFVENIIEKEKIKTSRFYVCQIQMHIIIRIFNYTALGDCQEQISVNYRVSQKNWDFVQF